MSDPLVSIIVPNYNHQVYLKERFDSIFNQKFTNYEVIILDDNSNDDSVKVIKKYASHPKVSHLLVNEKNSGSPFKQWKTGIKLSKGKYIWIAESDDIAEVTFLQKLVPLLECDNSVAIAYSQSSIIDSEGKRLFSYKKYSDWINRHKWEKDYKESGNTEIVQCLVRQNTLPNASAVLFRNEPNIENLISDEMVYCGDWFFWVNLLKDKNICFLSEELNCFRTHEGTTRNLRSEDEFCKRLDEELKVVSAIRAFFPELKDKFSFKEREMFNRYIDRFGRKKPRNWIIANRKYLKNNELVLKEIFIFICQYITRKLPVGFRK